VVEPDFVTQPVDSGCDVGDQTDDVALHLFDSSDDDSKLPHVYINGTEGTIGVDDEIRSDLTEGEYTQAFRFTFESESLALGQKIRRLQPFSLGPIRQFSLPFKSTSAEAFILSIYLSGSDKVNIVFPFVIDYYQ